MGISHTTLRGEEIALSDEFFINPLNITNVKPGHKVSVSLELQRIFEEG